MTDVAILIALAARGTFGGAAAAGVWAAIAVLLLLVSLATAALDRLTVRLADGWRSSS